MDYKRNGKFEELDPDFIEVFIKDNKKHDPIKSLIRSEPLIMYLGNDRFRRLSDKKKNAKKK